jgi:hypothetical protein
MPVDPAASRVQASSPSALSDWTPASASQPASNGTAAIVGDTIARGVGLTQTLQVAPANVALHTIRDLGTPVAGSPHGLGVEIWTPNDHQRVIVTDIHSVWQGGRNVGWIYTGSDRQKYFQSNHQYGVSISAQADLAQLAGKWINKVPLMKYLHFNVSSNDSPTGEIQPLKDQTRGCQVLPGFDPSVKARLAHDGLTFDGMPVSIGDTIPNGTPHGTTIVNADTLDNRGQTIGFLYRGSDGHRYRQFVPNGAGLPIGLGAEGFGVDVSNARYGPIQRFDALLPPGTNVERIIPNSAPLLGEGITG